MNLRKANKLIVNRHQGELTPSKDPLPYQLRAILAQGFTEQEGCIFLTAMLTRCRTLNQRNYPDKTGYESAVNDIHIEDLVDTMPMPRYEPLAVPKAVQVAVSFLASVSALLREKYPDYAFRGQVSEEEHNVTVGFHRVRTGEELLADVLEGFDDCVCEYDL